MTCLREVLGSTLATGRVPPPKDASFSEKTAARFLAKSSTRSSMARSSSGLASSITPTTPLIARSPPSTAPTASPSPPISNRPFRLSLGSGLLAARLGDASIDQSASFTGLDLPTPATLAYNQNEFKASSAAGNAIDLTYSYADSLNNNEDASHVFSIVDDLNSSPHPNLRFRSSHPHRLRSHQRNLRHRTARDIASDCDAWANLLSQAGRPPNYNGYNEMTIGSVDANGDDQISGFSYDAYGNTQDDGPSPTPTTAEARWRLPTASLMLTTAMAAHLQVTTSSLVQHRPRHPSRTESTATLATRGTFSSAAEHRIAILPAEQQSPSLLCRGHSRGLPCSVTTDAGAVCYKPTQSLQTTCTACTTPARKITRIRRQRARHRTSNNDFGAPLLLSALQPLAPLPPTGPTFPFPSPTPTSPPFREPSNLLPSSPTTESSPTSTATASTQIFRTRESHHSGALSRSHQRCLRVRQLRTDARGIHRPGGRERRRGRPAPGATAAKLRYASGKLPWARYISYRSEFAEFHLVTDRRPRRDER